MVAPFPHEAAGVAPVAHLRRIAGGIAGAGSHRVEVFAHEVGGAPDALARRVVHVGGHVRGDGDRRVEVGVVQDGRDLLESGVHARVDVRVLKGVVTLVVDDGAPAGALVNPPGAGR